MHCGSESAGAVPGPVCYDQGGEDPTITDTNVILGYINPNHLVGGELTSTPSSADWPSCTGLRGSPSFEPVPGRPSRARCHPCVPGPRVVDARLGGPMEARDGDRSSLRFARAGHCRSGPPPPGGHERRRHGRGWPWRGDAGASARNSVRKNRSEPAIPGRSGRDRRSPNPPIPDRHVRPGESDSRGGRALRAAGRPASPSCRRTER